MGLLTKRLAFAELCAKTNYSFLEGASHPEEMIETASAFQYEALGIVDRNGVYGIPRAHITAKKEALKLIVGSEVLVSGKAPIYLLAKNKKGYHNLCKLLTRAHQNNREDPQVSLVEVFENKDDLFLLLPVLNIDNFSLFELKHSFKDHFYLVVSFFLDGRDLKKVEIAKQCFEKFEVPCIASFEPLFHVVERKKLQDVVTAIRNTCALTEIGKRRLANAQRVLKSKEIVHDFFKNYPQWIENTLQISNQINFSLDEIKFQYPSEWLPAGETAISFLRQITEAGTKKRYPDGASLSVKKQLIHELQLIEELQYADYFLTIWDIIQFANSRNILCQGRGSAANSIVCYVLGITAIDPVNLNLLFERFISKERAEPPDIDIDFEHERREEVIQYLYQRYGRHRAAITAEVICYRRKSALREVAKVFAISMETLEKLQRLTHRRRVSDIPEEELVAQLPEIEPLVLKKFMVLVKEILGFPRHLGTHVGGFVLSQEPLNELVPIEKAAMPDRTIIQWDKNDLDHLGFVKVDVLGLGILTCIRKCFGEIQKIYGETLTLSSFKHDDNVFEAIQRADTIGVFQIESRAQMNMLPRLKPKNFYDLVIEISLVRPGPIQGDMVHPYLRRRAGKEPIEYAHPGLKSILEKTYGVPLFQEQIMKMAMEVAGFTAGEADELRRAMGTWKKQAHNKLTPMGEKFRKGLINRGIPEAFAQKVFSQIEGFAEYGFPESHAASFATLAYATAYLKYYYPDAYLVALLNSQPMGFYRSHTLIGDAIRHGVEVEGVDVQHSVWDTQLLQKNKTLLGFREIKGFPQAVSIALEEERKNHGEFLDFFDFICRLKKKLFPKLLIKRHLFFLAGAHAFRGFGISRREAFWEVQALTLDSGFAMNFAEEKTLLKEENPWEQVALDFEAQGVSLFAHPMALLREELQKKKVISSRQVNALLKGRRVKVAGLVICRQMPGTASGVLFISLEDEFGFVNIVVWNNIFQKYRDLILSESILECTGKLEKAEDGPVIHVIADSFSAVFSSETLPVSSYDFH